MPNNYINLNYIMTAPTEIYTLSLHDALPISHARRASVLTTGRHGDRADFFDGRPNAVRHVSAAEYGRTAFPEDARSEEHTSELQSRSDLVCRLLLEKKNNA